jgi:copper oxidase (laccase) domain-containing protein
MALNGWPGNERARRALDAVLENMVRFELEKGSPRAAQLLAAEFECPAALRAQLERAGVLPAHIDSAPPCTRCEPARFFSYRRDGRDGGVHMAFIGLV